MPSTPQRADPREIAHALAVLFRAGDVIELRIPETEREGVVSGYFSDHAALGKALAARNGDAGVYYTVNPIVPALLARCANRVKSHARTTTSDKDILRRRWLLIDCDAVRPAKISSTDEEHEAALARARQIRSALSEAGWPAPLLCDSGNGAHLLYAIDLPNDKDAAALVEAVLKALAARFSDDAVQVDTTMFNAARITKAYGTVARKGDSLPSRPHRLARILEEPETVEVVPRELLEKMVPPPPPAPPPPEAAAPAKRRASAASSKFSIDDFIRRHLKAETPVEWQGGRKWRLKECPFNPEHTSPDSAVFERGNGKLGFHCMHNSCQDKHWADVRQLFEPKKTKGRAKAPPSASPETSPEASPESSSPEVLREASIPEELQAATLSDAESGPEMLRDTEEFIRRYVVLPECAYLPVALWVIATHAVEQFDCFPYIAAVSAVKRSGKTRFAETIEPLAREAWRGTAPSPAALYRMLEGAPTLLLDETEVLNSKNKSEATQILLAVLNAGHRKGATIPRCEPPDWEVYQFPVYGPKFFAAIGRLPDTLLDRSIVVHMKRRSKAQKVERFRLARATAEAKPIHDSAARFANTYADAIAETYQLVLDTDLEYLSDRDADLWTPLFTMCAVIDSKYLPDLKKCALILSAAKTGDDTEDSWALTLLKDIKAVWPDGEDKCETSVLIEKLNALEESPWKEHPLTARKLAWMLRPFEVEPRNIQIETRRPKGYLLEHLQDAFDRYLDEKSATSATDQ